MQLLSALFLGRHVFSDRGAMAVFRGYFELAAETFVLKKEASASLKMERENEKKRPLDLIFVLHVMVILSLLEENDTLTS